MFQNNKLFFLMFLVVPLFLACCEKPQKVILDKEKMDAIKSVQLGDLEIQSLTYDPFISKTMRSLIVFELEKSGYVVMEEKGADALLTMRIVHNRYFRGIQEKDNMTIVLEIFDINNKKIGTVLFSGTSRKNLLNTGVVQKYIRSVVKIL